MFDNIIEILIIVAAVAHLSAGELESKTEVLASVLGWLLTIVAAFLLITRGF